MNLLFCVIVALVALMHTSARFLTEDEGRDILQSGEILDPTLREALEENRVLEGEECNDWKDDPGDPGNREGRNSGSRHLIGTYESEKNNYKETPVVFNVQGRRLCSWAGTGSCNGCVPQALAQQTSIQPLVTIEGGITRFVAAPLVPQDLYLRVAQIRVTRVKQVNMYLILMRHVRKWKVQ